MRGKLFLEKQVQNLLIRKFLLLLLPCLLIFQISNAQVASYTFAQSTGTYTALSTSTTLFASGWDDSVGTVSIPFTFTFNGQDYTSCDVNSNGYITFGGASATTDYNPISQTVAYNGAVAAMGRDMISNSSAVVYGVVGSSPNREFVIQWNNARRYSVGARNGNYNFQIHLKETTNEIIVVYNSATSTYATDLFVQIGLRGSSNADYNNRLSATNFSSTTAGTANSSNVVTGNTAAKNPTAGLTYTWTPPKPIIITPSAPSICSGGSVSLTASSTSAYTYTWSPATGLSATTGATVTASPTTTTTYTVTGTLGAVVVTKKSNCRSVQHSFSSEYY